LKYFRFYVKKHAKIYIRHVETLYGKPISNGINNLSVAETHGLREWAKLTKPLMCLTDLGAS